MTDKVVPIGNTAFAKYQQMVSDLKGKRALVLVVDSDNQLTIHSPDNASNYEQVGWCMKAAIYLSNS